VNQPSLIGSKLGKYQIRTEIGRGGMGAVYKGYDPMLDRYIALKVLAPHLVWEKDFVERFLREARAAARLKHPNIVTIYDVGQEGGWYYYVMEYLEGQSLMESIQRQGALSPEKTITILRPLAGALDYAHHEGLVHRDIKPGNIILGKAGRVTLTDFGIARAAQQARLTATGAILGSPAYMSPEQAKGLSVDARSDQYSLAVVAYEMLSGQVPFQADSTLSLMYKVVHEPPPPIRQVVPGLPAGVEAVLGQALAKKPGDRYGTVSAFVEELDQALAGKKMKARFPPAQQKPTATLAESPTVMIGPGRGAAKRPIMAGTPIPKAVRTRTPAVKGPTRRRVPAWIWALGSLAVLVVVVGLMLALSGAGGKGTPPPASTSTLRATTESFAATAAIPSASDGGQLSTQGKTPRGPTATLASTSTPLPTSSPTWTPPPPPTRTPMPTRTAAPTRTPAYAPTSTSMPTSRPQSTKPLPTVTQKPKPTANNAQYPAPLLSSPPDGQDFTEGDTIMLTWKPVGTLAPDAYYVITVAYTPASAPDQTWLDETPWIKDTQWALSEHSYLPGLSADDQFRWSVQVMRKTGTDAQGKPTGTPLSPMSEVRMLTWKAAAKGGNEGGGEGPSPKPTRTPRSP
jgi:hypothetical protein